MPHITDLDLSSQVIIALILERPPVNPIEHGMELVWNTMHEDLLCLVMVNSDHQRATSHQPTNFTTGDILIDKR